MFRKSNRVTDVAIKKRSRVPGVTITQYVEQLPAGKSTPDFIRKPMPTTVQEGKKALLKAMVSGEPAPTVTWERNKGQVNDPEKYKTRYDGRTREHILEIPSVKPDQADTYKCFATNEYGKAIVTATLNVIEVGFKKKGQPGTKLTTGPKFSLSFLSIIQQSMDGEIDPKLWELLISAPKKDYERICFEFGITDFRWMLKRLNQLKKERADEQAKVVEKVDKVKQIEVKPDGRAEFSLDMTLCDPNSAINLYKDGTMVPYGDDEKSKHSLKKKGSSYIFSIKDPQPEDAGFYQVDVEEANVLSTDFQVPAVEFIAKIKDVKAVESDDAVFQCVLSTPLNSITWSKQDSSLEHGNKYEITVSEDKLIHTLRVKDCKMEDHGAYYAIAGITSSSASLTVEGGTSFLPKKLPCAALIHFSPSYLRSTNIILYLPEVAYGFYFVLTAADRGVQFVSGLSDTDANVGERAELSCKLSSDTSEGHWYKNGKLLTNGDGVTIIKDGACHRLIIDCCKEDDAAVYRFEAEGRKSEATLNVQDPPTIDGDALGKFAKPVIIKAGENAEWKLPFSGGAPMNIKWYKDDDELLPGLNVKIDTSATKSQLRLTKCQRKDSGEVKIKIKNEFGTTEAISKLIVLDKPTPPQGPVDIMESAITSVEFKWKPPKDDGGCPITNYIIERQQVGRNKWSDLSEISGSNPSYKDSDVDPGRRYCYRIRAKNTEGISDYLQTEDIQAGVLRYPGPPAAPKVVSAFKDCINLSWSPPCDTGGTKILGYNLEKNKKGTNYWSHVNQGGPITDTKYAVKDVFEGAAYEFRVSAINLSGAGDPSIPCDTVIARDPMMKPKFKDRNMKTFVVVRSGNTVRLHINFEASPLPDISWLKDGIPVSKHVTITNSDKGSQLLIPTSERSDTGIYTITVKNLAGQESFNVEFRVTDDPKPPGPVELDQNIQGTVTLSWSPSPDEKRDDRLHYMVSKRDSFKRTWRTVADNLFNNKFTVVNILPGREYYFRVFAKNDIGLSPPSQSPVFGAEKEKGKFKVNVPERKRLDFQSPPSFILPLRRRTAPQGYECHMSCAVKGDPAPRVTWYYNNISLNTNTNYHITNVCGVCSLLILRVGAKDNGEYKVVIENKLGTAECSMTLNVKGKETCTRFKNHT
uniref:Immunoglobulin-like and fibronectin type III domain-containing protein 1 n=1 Tax=Seriola lalandi dorsalis TaxID=1841481 RepID=A0A3B4XAI0_SERLL